jgi:acetyltransferase-like isoleucine patch superfamily enzyme
VGKEDDHDGDRTDAVEGRNVESGSGHVRPWRFAEPQWKAGTLPEAKIGFEHTTRTKDNVKPIPLRADKDPVTTPMNPFTALRRDMGHRRFDPKGALLASVARALPANAFPGVRARMYRALGVRIESGAAILGSFEMLGEGRVATRLVISEGALVSPRCIFGLDNTISIGRNVAIGPGVTLTTATHSIGFGSQRMNRVVESKPIVIEDGAWIGLQSIVLAGVTIGHGAVVSAGSVVTQDVPPDTLVQGNPAVVVRNLPFGNR